MAKDDEGSFVLMADAEADKAAAVAEAVEKATAKMRKDLEFIATQSLIVLQLDFGYSPDLPCRYGQHPMRHSSLWNESLRVLGDENPEIERTKLPDVEETREIEAAEDAQ